MKNKESKGRDRNFGAWRTASKNVLFDVAVLVVLILVAVAVLALGQKGYISPADIVTALFVFTGAVLGYVFRLTLEGAQENALGQKYLKRISDSLLFVSFFGLSVMVIAFIAAIVLLLISQFWGFVIHLWGFVTHL
jgi:hypothetical protein